MCNHTKRKGKNPTSVVLFRQSNLLGQDGSELPMYNRYSICEIEMFVNNLDCAVSVKIMLNIEKNYIYTIDMKISV